MSQSSEVYLGLDRPCLGSNDCDPILKWWESNQLYFAAAYWEQRPWDPKFTRWAKMAREEIAIRRVTKVLLQ